MRLQYLVHIAEVFQHDGQHHKAQHDLHARHPTAAARKLGEVAREKSKQEKRRRESGGEGHHAKYRLRALGLYRGNQQRPHDGSDAGK